jgi:CRISPR/Cas system-associated protein Csx1
MSLQLFMSSLSLEQLKELLSDMNDAGLKKEFKQKYRTIFRNKRSISKGRIKKIYSALAKTNDSEMDRIIDAMIEFEYKIREIK